MLDPTPYRPLFPIAERFAYFNHAGVSPLNTRAADAMRAFIGRRVDEPIVDDKQSAHLRITGTLKASGYTVVRDELVFQRTLKGLRNTVLLPKGWEVSGVSQSATIGTDRNGRAFVALINLNSENSYRVTIRATRSTP